MLQYYDIYSPYIVLRSKKKSIENDTKPKKILSCDALTRSRTGGPANKLYGKAGGYRYPINAYAKYL